MRDCESKTFGWLNYVDDLSVSVLVRGLISEKCNYTEYSGVILLTVIQKYVIIIFPNVWIHVIWSNLFSFFVSSICLGRLYNNPQWKTVTFFVCVTFPWRQVHLRHCYFCNQEFEPNQTGREIRIFRLAFTEANWLVEMKCRHFCFITRSRIGREWLMWLVASPSESCPIAGPYGPLWPLQPLHTSNSMAPFSKQKLLKDC